MVHISEVANGFVSEIKDHLQEGQTVKVKVLTIAEDGKIGLSIKKATETPRPPRQQNFRRDDKPGGNNNFNRQSNYSNEKKQNQPPANSFEDMLSKFKQNSEEKMGDLKRNIDSKRKSGSRRSGPKS